MYSECIYEVRTVERGPSPSVKGGEHVMLSRDTLAVLLALSMKRVMISKSHEEEGEEFSGVGAIVNQLKRRGRKISSSGFSTMSTDVGPKKQMFVYLWR